MVSVMLKPITRANWETAVRLKVADDQKMFVAPNVYSLAEAAYEPNMFPHGIYDGEVMVGFLMYGYEEFNGYKLWDVLRLMVGHMHQRKGYGRAAMAAIIDYLHHETDADGVVISYVPENVAAAKLYASLGFVGDGAMIEDEILLRLPFPDKIAQQA